MKSILALPALFFSLTGLMNADTSLYEIPLVDIDGTETSLQQFESKAMLIVNVASKCGFTRQYAGLEELSKEYQDRGLVVLGFPCNQFGGQEPGSEAEIKEFCRLTYGVSFPMFSKVEVNGSNRHPLYERLAGESSPFAGNIKWNFSKFLVDSNGTIVGRFGSSVAPKSSKLIDAIEAALPDS